MKKSLTIIGIALMLISCSAEKDCKTCHAEFINVNTGETINVEADCDRIPPAEGFVFVKCVDKPDY